MEPEPENTKTEVLDETEQTEQTEEELLESAVKANEEKPEQKPADTVPLAVVTELRESRREAREETAALRQEMSELRASQAASAATPTKSPMEVAAEQQGVTLDEVEISGKLYNQQRKWEQAQDATAQEKTAVTQRAAAAKRSYAKAKTDLSSPELLAAGLDVDTVIREGQKNLTQGDIFDIQQAGEDAMTIMYQRILDRTPALQQKHTTFGKPAPKPKPKNDETPKLGEDGKPIIEKAPTAPVDEGSPFTGMLQHLFDGQ